MLWRRTTGPMPNSAARGRVFLGLFKISGRACCTFPLLPFSGNAVYLSEVTGRAQSLSGILFLGAYYRNWNKHPWPHSCKTKTYTIGARTLGLERRRRRVHAHGPPETWRKELWGPGCRKGPHHHTLRLFDTHSCTIVFVHLLRFRQPLKKALIQTYTVPSIPRAFSSTRETPMRATTPCRWAVSFA